ncbi:S24/S26 family peptidase [Microlunatus soli]|uniref:Signal peptidase I n=1 Tax=Microlunatus soli TaxID=630515 RepID=A0A1H1QZV4_9ACTN|nr:hypothetical protein [Microlunatus soli]SDS29054.1 signal peptidase I [Microlunatus soli]
MINIGIQKIAREVALTLGAALGLLCLLGAVATPLFGIRLLVFQSGSMSPTIGTGGAAVTRTVPAGDLERGDIVSVTSSDGTRVTHRITDVTHNGDRARLTLRGDANSGPDRERYTVTSADRVIWHADGLGYLLRTLASPYVIFVAGGAALGLLVLAFRRPSRQPHDNAANTTPAVAVDAGAQRGSRRPKIIGTAVALAALGGGGLAAGLTGGASSIAPTLASFTDTAEVDGDFATMTVPTPAASTIANDDDDVDCTNGTWLSGVVWVGWSNLSNQPANYRYLVDVYFTDPTSPDVTYTVTDKMATIRHGDLKHGTGTYHARVSGALAGTSWRSAESLERTIEVGSGGTDIRCNGPYTRAAASAAKKAERSDTADSDGTTSSDAKSTESKGADTKAADADKSDAEKSDEEAADAEKSGAEKSDEEAADAEQADAEKSDAKDSDAKDAEDQAADGKEADDKAVDNGDADAKDSDKADPAVCADSTDKQDSSDEQKDDTKDSRSDNSSQRESDGPRSDDPASCADTSADQKDSDDDQDPAVRDEDRNR